MGYVASRNQVSDDPVAGPHAGRQVRQRLSHSARLTLPGGVSLFLVFALLSFVQAQSGRRKSESKQTPSPIDSTPATTSTAKTPQKPNSGSSAQEKKRGTIQSSNDVDAPDIIDEGSNLGALRAA